jgi:Flp pilus assembly protein CpaB
MLKFLKMMEEEDAIITEEVLEVLAEEAQEAQEEKVLEDLLQDVKVLAVLEATEALHQEKVVLAEEKVHLIERQDVPKVQVILQDQEDQEEINIIC